MHTLGEPRQIDLCSCRAAVVRQKQFIHALHLVQPIVQAVRWVVRPIDQGRPEDDVVQTRCREDALALRLPVSVVAGFVSAYSTCVHPRIIASSFRRMRVSFGSYTEQVETNTYLSGRPFKFRSVDLRSSGK